MINSLIHECKDGRWDTAIRHGGIKIANAKMDLVLHTFGLNDPKIDYCPFCGAKLI